MVDYFGEFEAKRITQYLKKNDIISVSFPEFFRTANTLFNEDLDEIISQCFEKLDLSDVGYLSVKYIRQGLLVNARTHIDPTMKTHTKALLKYVYNMRSTIQVNKPQFIQYIKSCLQSPQEAVDPKNKK